jgi:hypothetical protein
LEGHNIGIQQGNSQEDQEDDPHDRSRQRRCPKQQMRRRHACDDESKDNNERVVCSDLDHGSSRISHRSDFSGSQLIMARRSLARLDNVAMFCTIGGNPVPIFE